MLWVMIVANPALHWLHKAWPDQASRQADIVRGYKQAFGEPDKPHVQDAAAFCFVYDTTHVPGDPYTSGLNEGRRQAYLHIMNMLQITQAEITALNERKANTNGNRPDERKPDRPADER